ncbi:MAG TPA: VTC domain-containing protein [Pseudobdellovibrionaceae bacterium]
MSHYERKYYISGDKVGSILSELSARYAHTDIYPCSIVDSIYYDTLNLDFFRQCNDGSSTKTKVRIRRYNKDPFQQVQVKKKRGFEVIKQKWEVEGLDPFNPLCRQKVMQTSGIQGLQATTQIIYKRHRFRVEDMRITFDSNIQFQSMPGYVSVRKFGRLPFSVLEIKSSNPDSQITLLRDWGLSVNSFSKYYLAQAFFFNRADVFNKFF